MKVTKGFLYALAGILFVGCAESAEVVSEYSTDIYVNQHVYVNGAANKVLIKDYEGEYKVITVPEGKVVLKGSTTALKAWEDAGESLSAADISAITETGTYQLQLADGQGSEPFTVGQASAYEEVSIAAYRSFYLNRAGVEITEEYGGKFARKAGHYDTAVVVHESVENSSYKPGTVLSLSGGWYDAGDYGKYIVNSATTVYTMAMAYEQYPEYHKGLNLNIPESGSNIPDVIEELLVNVRWMLLMQDVDGGVHHKLTTARFDGFLMPDKTSATRYLFMKSTEASLTFAASIGSFARVIEGIDGLDEFAAQCKEAAVKAWQWAVENPDVHYIQPEGVNTGQYNSRELEDEWQWAGVELYITTGDVDYLKNVDFAAKENPNSTPSWGMVHSFAMLSAIWNPNSFDSDVYEAIKKAFLQQVDELYTIYDGTSAKVSLNFWRWASNSDIANQAMLGFEAYKLIGDIKYLNMATNNIDYLMGRNPTGYSFVTGIGTKPPMNIHHRPSGADGIEEPHPGFLVGGPNLDVLQDCADTTRSEFPAMSFMDETCSFSTNECAINWTAALIYVSAAMASL